MTDATDILASSESTGSMVQAMQKLGPTCLIHIGRPDQEEPHKSMKRVVKLRKENPAMKLFILVWSEADRDAMLPYEDEKVKVLLWDDDNKLSTFLMDFLTDLAGAFIIGPRHYVCTEKHITEGGYAGLVEKCGTCGEACMPVVQFEEKVQEFAELFGKVIRLVNFDTRSGEVLTSIVSPTANIINNAPYFVGCDHEKPEDYTGREEGKTAIIVGAGPSLEDSISDIRRLSERGDHFVICVGRVFKLLKGAGVRIGYTASCEMFEWDAAIFDGLSRTDAGDSVLAFASMCAPATVRKWPGKKAVMLDLETAKLMNRKDWIYGGNSVAHHMLNWSMQVLKAKDAILVGIDLAYPKPKTHAEGANHEGWPEEIRKAEDQFQTEAWVPCTGKGNNFDPDCHRVPVAMGGGVAISTQILVRSSPSYECFATLFEVLISKHGKKVWNASGNGQKIGGTEYIDLAGYLNG